jgi:hypothetical protein
MNSASTMYLPRAQRFPEYPRTAMRTRLQTQCRDNESRELEGSGSGYPLGLLAAAPERQSDAQHSIFGEGQACLHGTGPGGWGGVGGWVGGGRMAGGESCGGIEQWYERDAPATNKNRGQGWQCDTPAVELPRSRFSCPHTSMSCAMFSEPTLMSPPVLATRRRMSAYMSKGPSSTSKSFQRSN